MARNKIYIDVVVDDNGTTRRVAVDSDRLSQSLGRTATQSAQADRNIKGVAQASSNATKNFSKMSQGMGGLVAAYATVAAQVFALSAAYQFLLEASDFTILLKGQEALTATTGVAYSSITKSIQQATNAQLTYKEAAQAAAISTAAGLGADQITRIAKLSDTISKTLGRDLTDTFNRLTRGITKAEPELLDELGIVLRLRDAQAEYARSIGKSADALTAYERTQAVFLFTIGQGEEKFGALGDALGSSSNKVRQLGVALSQVGDQLKPVISSVSEFIAGALTQNITASVATFGLLAGGVLRQLLPSIKEIGDRYKVTLDGINGRIDTFNEKLKQSAINQRILARGLTTETQAARTAFSGVISEARVQRGAQGIDPQKISKTMQGISAGTIAPSSLSFKKFRADVEKELLKLEATNQQVVTNMKSQFVTMTREQVLAMKIATDIMANDLRGLQEAQEGVLTTTERSSLLISLFGARIAGFFTETAERVATFGLRLLNFVGYIGLIITAVQLLSEGWKLLTGYINELNAEKTLKPLSERLTSLNEETKTLVQSFESMQKKATSFNLQNITGQIKFFGAAASNISLDSVVQSFAKLEGSTDFIKNATAQVNKYTSEIGKARLDIFDRPVDQFGGMIVGEEANRIKDLIDKQEAGTQVLDNLTSARQKDLLATTASLAAYAKLNPELSSQASDLEKTAQSLENLAKERETEKISAEDYAKALQKEAKESKTAAIAVGNHAEAMARANGNLKSLEQATKSYTDRIASSVSLGPIEQSFVDLSAIVLNYNATIDAAIKSGKKFTGSQISDLTKVKNTYGPLIKEVKALYNAQANLAAQSARLENRKKELDLIEGTTASLIRLRAAEELKGLDLRRQELEQEQTALDLRIKEITKDGKIVAEKAAQALSTEAGESLTSAGEIAGSTIGNAIEKAADYHARRITEAIAAGEDNSLEAARATNKALDAFLRDLESAALAREPKQKENEGQTVTAASRMDQKGLVSQAQVALKTLQNQIGVFEIKIEGIDIDELAVQLKVEKDIFENSKNQIDLVRQQSAVTQTIVDSMQESVSKSEALVKLNSRELQLASLTLEQYDSQRQVQRDLLTQNANLTQEQLSAYDQITTQGRQQYEREVALAKLKQSNLEFDLRAAQVAEKYNNLLVQRTIEEQYLSLTKGAYADNAREAFAVASANDQVLKGLENIAILERRALELNNKIANAKDGELTILLAQRDNLKENYKLQYQTLLQDRVRLNVLQQQASEIYKIGEAARSALGEGLTQEFAKILKGGAVDLEQSALALIQTVGNAVADQMAKMLSDATLDLFGMGPKSEAEKARQRAEEEARIIDEKLAQTFNTGGSTLSSAINTETTSFISQLNNSFTTGAQQFATAISSSIPTIPRTTPSTPPIGTAVEAKAQEIKGDAAGIPIDISEVKVRAKRIPDSQPNPPASDLSSAAMVGPEIEKAGVSLSEKFSSVFKGLKTDLTEWKNQVSTVFSDENSSFFDKLGSVFSSDAPWLQGLLGGLAGAVSTFAISKLAGGDRNSWRAAIVGGIVSGLSFGFNSAIGGMFSAANGGVAKGGFREFAYGGVVNKPTLGLVGEGMYNEAVVPLPDGKSIPVIMKQEAPESIPTMIQQSGDKNNVSINVTVNSNGQTEAQNQGTGDRGVAMAQAMSAVVIQEIKRQKRHGGLLSPYS